MAAKIQQSERTSRDPWFETVATWLRLKCQANQHGDGFTVAQILSGSLSMPSERIDHKAALRVAAIMKELQWTSARRKINGVRENRYYAPILLEDGWT